MRAETTTRTTPWLIPLVAAGLLGMLAILASTAPDRIDAIRLAIRATARSSLVLFLLAFSASGMARLGGAGWARWPLRNRRSLGLGFAISHLLHLGAIFALAWDSPDLFDTLTTPASFVFGGSAYLVILAMAVTSFAGPAAAIGPKVWHRLHSGGIWFLWLMFVINFGKRVPAHPSYTIAILLCLAALFLRVVGARKAREPISG